MTKSIAQITVAFFLLFASWFAVGTRAPAQDKNGPIFQSFRFDQADIRQALRDTFKRVGVSYSIAPEVQGVVTLELRNVTFEVALEHILRQVEATYRIEGGVFCIFRKGSINAGDSLVIPAPQSGSATLVGMGTAMTQDSRYLYIVQDSMLYKVQKSDLKVVNRSSLRGEQGGAH